MSDEDNTAPDNEPANEPEDLKGLARQDQDPNADNEPDTEPDNEPPQVTPEDIEQRKQDKARQAGWKPLDEWVSEGGDPDQWRPAGEFLLYGEMVDKLKSYEEGFERRAQRLEKYYTAQMEAQRKEWENKLSEAAESGDKEQVMEANKALRQLDQQAQQSEQDQGPSPEQQKLEQWNAKNQWIHENTPKANHAKTVFAQAVNNGSPVDQALQLVESEVARHYPDESGQNRKAPPTGEKGSGNKGFKKSSGGKLTFDDLTDEEKMTYRAVPQAWKSQDEFVKAAEEARKAEKKS